MLHPDARALHRPDRKARPARDAHADAGRSARVLPRPALVHAAARARDGRRARHALRRPARADPAAHLPPGRRRCHAVARVDLARARVLPRRRLDDRRPRHPRRAVPPALQRLRRRGRLGRLPHGPGAPLPRRRRRLPGGDALGASQRRASSASIRRGSRSAATAPAAISPPSSRSWPAMPATCRSRISSSSIRPPTCGAGTRRTPPTAAATC